MVPTYTEICVLADRLEQAFLRRCPGWNPYRVSPGVWESAAASLYELHRRNPSMPLDPELYVAAQSEDWLGDDPWSELTQAESLRRFEKKVRRIEKSLRNELLKEIREILRRVRRSEVDLEQILEEGSGRWSSLACYIAAYRENRHGLAERFREGAIRQHKACPLYRQASQGLLSPSDYPTTAKSLSTTGAFSGFSLN